MKIIVTGSSGFIGTNFISSTTLHQIIEVDLLIEKVSEINFSGVDVVLHLAALVHQMKGAPESEYFKINRDLAYDVAIRAKEQGVKQFIFMSTVKVFGESTTRKDAWSESSLCNPSDPYGKSKYEAELLLTGLQSEVFNVAVVRSPLVYGIGVKANMYNLIKLIDRFSILPFADINNRRSIVYVGNLVSLLQHIITKQSSGIFIAGDESPISTTTLTRLIAKSFPKKIYLVRIPVFIRKLGQIIMPSIIDRLFGSLELNNSLTFKELGFTPPFSTEQGILEMVEWYKSNSAHAKNNVGTF